MMLAIAASVALGVAVVLWSQSPTYSVLTGSLQQQDAAQVLDVLRQSNIEYQVDGTTGSVMVPSAKLQEAKMKLASAGLPRSDGLGFELLQQDRSFGSSRLVEAARYQKAMEGELARTIATLTSVQTARVHLATPKRSVFVQPRKVVSASVVVKLYPGRVMDRGQVDSIVHLVASSVPELEASRVTVVDHKGNLLSGREDDRAMGMTNRQFDYTSNLEKHYKRRIEELLAPIVGADRVHAEVTADIDFTAVEQTAEQYNPDSQAVRSEQYSEQGSGPGSAGGVPGALSNQPPAAGSAPEQAGGATGGSAGGASGSSSKNSLRNYEVDRTISHTRQHTGRLRRLSVAVVVDDRIEAGANEGEVKRIERTPEEIDRIAQLVREAIGYNVQRGDSVKVINSAFILPPAPEPLPEVPLWEQTWVLDIAKVVGGWILVLLLILLVLKPTLQKMTANMQLATSQAHAGAGVGAEGMAGEAGMAAGPDDLRSQLINNPGEPLQLTGKESYEEVLDAARHLISEDPKRVAQLVKQWIAEGNT
jgi:flagellar M-ring protein FliF